MVWYHNPVPSHWPGKVPSEVQLCYKCYNAGYRGRPVPDFTHEEDAVQNTVALCVDEQRSLTSPILCTVEPFMNVEMVDTTIVPPDSGVVRQGTICEETDMACASLQPTDSPNC